MEAHGSCLPSSLQATSIDHNHNNGLMLDAAASILCIRRINLRHGVTARFPANRQSPQAPNNHNNPQRNRRPINHHKKSSQPADPRAYLAR